MKQYVIQPKEEGKGRSFSAVCVATITAYGQFPEGNDGKTIRPVWTLFAGTEAELRAFMANLKGGRKAELSGYGKKGDDERLEYLRNVGFQLAWQREEEGALCTIYHPEMFRLDPGLIDPKGINFVLLVPTDWSNAQQVDTAAAVKHVQGLAPEVDPTLLTTLVPAAYLFAAYLDRRTGCPLVADGRFYLQLLVAALDKGIASLPGHDIKYNSTYRDQEWGHHRHHEFDVEIGSSSERLGLESIGFQHAISVQSKHAPFEEFLAEQVILFYKHSRGSKLRRSQVDVSQFLET
jgi:hypothetical protein